MQVCYKKLTKIIKDDKWGKQLPVNPVEQITIETIDIEWNNDNSLMNKCQMKQKGSKQSKPFEKR